MTKTYLKKYYLYVSRHANRDLLWLFRESVKMRYECMDGGWTNKREIQKIEKFEKVAMVKVKKMLRRGEVVARDDFFRAAHFFQHSLKIEDYAMAVTLYSISGLLGDDWGKNHQALAVDRFLLALNQPQIFGTQFERNNKKWKISDYRTDITDKLRKMYDVPPIKESIKRAETIGSRAG